MSIWSLKLTIVFLATATNAQGHPTVTETLTREMSDDIAFFDERSCKLKAQWWLSPAASATGAVKKAECVEVKGDSLPVSVRGPAFPDKTQRGPAYPK